MNQKQLNIFFITVIVVLLVFLGYFIFKNDKQKMGYESNNRITDSKENEPIISSVNPPSDITDNETTMDETIDWTTYHNNEIGFSFKYPKEFGDFNVSIQNGDSGKMFRGGFPSFTNVWHNNKFFSVGANTETFGADRSISFLDFIKYSKELGKYFDYKAQGKKYEFQPVKTLTVDGQQVLIVGDNSYINDRTSELLVGPGSNGGALVNLPEKSEFKGMAIWNADINKLSQEKFEKILSTFEFN